MPRFTRSVDLPPKLDTGWHHHADDDPPDVFFQRMILHCTANAYGNTGAVFCSVVDSNVARPFSDTLGPLGGVSFS